MNQTRTFPSYIKPENRSAVDARIGELVREGNTIYYATLAGNRHVEDESFAEIAALVDAEVRS